MMTLKEALAKVDLLKKAHKVEEADKLQGELFSSIDVPPVGEVVVIDLKEVYQTEGGKSTYCLVEWGGGQHLFKLNWLWNYLPKLCNDMQRVGAYGAVAEDLRGKGTVDAAWKHLKDHNRIRRTGAKKGYNYSFDKDGNVVKDPEKRIPAEVYGWEWVAD